MAVNPNLENTKYFIEDVQFRIKYRLEPTEYNDVHPYFI